MINILLCSFYINGAHSKYSADFTYAQLLSDLDYSHQIYSGLLSAGVNKSFHYVLFLSQGKPRSDPLILWLNGGPGCSSMLGAFTQNGPYKFHQNSTDMYLNNYSWNRNASVLYIESPGGVGFSTGPVQSDDQSVSYDNLNALLTFFFEKFPQMLSLDFYISGQSYAGIYVPYLALRIHQYNKRETTSQNDRIPLKGIMVGNACTHPKQCYEPGIARNSYFVYQYLRQRFYYTQKQWNDFRALCSFDYNDQKCQTAQDVLQKKFNGTQTSIYDIYGKCWHQKNNNSILKDDLSCLDNIGINTFLNSFLVKRALHVNTDITWTGCNDDVSSNYTMHKDASYWIYPILMEHYQILIYSGDADACVPITGSIYWLQLMQQQFKLPISQPWRLWKYGSITGGSTFKLGKNITFASIRGAGHMVPSTQPQLAYHLLGHFLGHHPLDKQQ